MTFDRNEAIRFGWDTTKKNLAFFIGILIISGIFQFLPDVFNKFVLQPVKGNLILILFRMIVILTFAAINMIISIGLIIIPLKFADNEKPQFADLFSGARFFFKYIISSILCGIIVIIGFCLLIIPGIILAIRFSFYMFFIVDKDAGPVEALKSSFNLTRGHTWNIFIFGIILILLNFLGVLALFVGLFITIPITMVAYAYVYRQLTSESLEMAVPKADFLSETKKDIQPKIIDISYKDEKMGKMIDETEKSKEDILEQNQEERASKYDDVSDSERKKRDKKQRKEKSSSKLPSKVQILSKIGLSRTGELIGVDIGTSAIKLSVIKKTKDGYTLTHLAKKSYKENLLSEGNIIDNNFVAQEIKNIITANKIKSSIAACALSSYSVITKKARLPIFEEKGVKIEKSKKLIFEDTASIEAEIENSIPFPLRDINYSFHVLGLDQEDENFVNILIVAAKKEIVDGYINTFKMAGLNLVLLDSDILALINIVEQI
ncbi:MAG: DUF975 family protein, partial [Candidatus Goldbacteria bacterium]|nr:DUF975 family protein [Candidatus Goldiibacteriota bacterium]